MDDTDAAFVNLPQKLEAIPCAGVAGKPVRCARKNFCKGKNFKTPQESAQADQS
jgi:hypothetical protein